MPRCRPTQRNEGRALDELPRGHPEGDEDVERDDQGTAAQALHAARDDAEGGDSQRAGDQIPAVGADASSMFILRQIRRRRVPYSR